MSGPEDMEAGKRCKFAALEQEKEDLRVLKDKMRATLIQTRTMVEELVEHWEKADDGNPDNAEHEVDPDSLATVMAQYCHELRGKWLRQNGKKALETLKVSARAMDEVMEVVTRQDNLIANL